VHFLAYRHKFILQIIHKAPPLAKLLQIRSVFSTKQQLNIIWKTEAFTVCHLTSHISGEWGFTVLVPTERFLWFTVLIQDVSTEARAFKICHSVQRADKTGTRTAEKLWFSLHAKYHQHYITQEPTILVSELLYSIQQVQNGEQRFKEMCYLNLPLKLWCLPKEIHGATYQKKPVWSKAFTATEFSTTFLG
jgi:hypothetical protein